MQSGGLSAGHRERAKLERESERVIYIEEDGDGAGRSLSS